jgi:hypothetical protein
MTSSSVPFCSPLRFIPANKTASKTKEDHRERRSGLTGTISMLSGIAATAATVAALSSVLRACPVKSSEPPGFGQCFSAWRRGRKKRRDDARGIYIPVRTIGIVRRLAFELSCKMKEAAHWRAHDKDPAQRNIPPTKRHAAFPACCIAFGAAPPPGAPSTAANLRQAAQYFGIGHSYHKDFIAIGSLLRSPRWQPPTT